MLTQPVPALETPTATENLELLTPAVGGTPVKTDPAWLERRTLNIDQSAAAVGVSRRTIYNWVAADKVAYVRTAGGSIRIYADSLMKG